MMTGCCCEKRVDEKRTSVHSLLTDLWRERHCCVRANRQETLFMRFDRQKEKGDEESKRAASSPGWRVWTVCFGLCVVWPATSCSRGAVTRPRKKCSVSTDGEPKAGPETTLADLSWQTFNQTVGLVKQVETFYLRGSDTHYFKM